MRRWVALCLFLLPLLTWGLAHAQEAPTAQRFALVVGVNDGGPERVRLRYAGTDALAVGRVLTELGGVHPDDAVVLLDVDREGLSDGLDRVAASLAQVPPGVRSELFFYYSGHSDETGLLLGGEHVPYSDLREALAELPADVRIGVLDSCASGAFTRRKGGVRRSPFLANEGEVRGHAFLTSSSEDEASQESDRLGGSFFTYALISGLRGAADQTGDGRVSLNEVYQFAFHETLRRTESTLGGPQHPAYDIQLAGSGDLVLTDLRAVSAGLVLAEPLDGRVTIRDADGALEVELRKFAGQPVTLGLERGGYTVRWDDGVTVREAVVVLGDGVAVELRGADFVPVDLEVAVLRGDAEVGIEEAAPVEAAPVQEPVPSPRVGRVPNLVPLNVSFVPPLDVNTWRRGPDLNHVNLFVLGAHSHAVHGVSVGLGVAVVRDMRGAQVATVNWATLLDGAQVGVVNLVRDGKGVQVGLVNVAGTLDGVMVGLVNVAEDAEFAFGLLNFVRKGVFHVDVWASDSELVNVGVKFGARHTYTSLSGGAMPVGDPHGRFGLGFGVRLPQLGPLVLDLDGMSSVVFDATGRNKVPAFRQTTRALVNVRAAKHFGLFFGPTLHVQVSRPGVHAITGEADDAYGLGREGAGLLPVLTADTDRARVQVWPGGVLGLSF